MFSNNKQILDETKISINYANLWLKLTLELRWARKGSLNGMFWTYFERFLCFPIICKFWATLKFAKIMLIYGSNWPWSFGDQETGPWKWCFGAILEDFYVFQKYANFGRHQINLRAPLTKKRILKRDVLDLFRKISMFSNNMQILGDTKLSLELCWPRKGSLRVMFWTYFGRFLCFSIICKF